MAGLQQTTFPGDAISIYHPWGIRLANGFLAASELLRGRRFWGTDAVTLMTGIWYEFVGAHFYGLFVVSGIFSFLASCFVLLGARRIYRSEKGFLWAALALFFLPSLLIWNGLYGKDAYIALGTGLCIYGAVLFEKHRVGGAALLFGFGTAVSFLVRPHMAAIEVVAFCAAIAVGRGRRWIALLVSAVCLAILIHIGADTVIRYVGLQTLNPEEVASALTQHNADLSRGGSASGIGGAISGGGVAGLVRMLPLSIAAMLAMPLPGQLGFNPVQLLVALETAFVFLLVVRLGPNLLRRVLRDRPFAVTFACMYVGIFLVLMSVPLSANLGLMVRERTAVWLPLLFALFAGVRDTPRPGADPGAGGPPEPERGEAEPVLTASV